MRLLNSLVIRSSGLTIKSAIFRFLGASSPLSVMGGQMYSPVFVSTDGSTDESLRKTRTWLYPMQAWYCISLFIFIIALFQWISFFHSKFARGRQMSYNSDPEQVSLHRLHGFSLRRIPLGLVTAYRVIAFRWTLQIGKSHSLTMAEVLVTMIYVVFLFVWAFINSKPPADTISVLS
jgi:ferric-chelate reductase